MREEIDNSLYMQWIDKIPVMTIERDECIFSERPGFSTSEILNYLNGFALASIYAIMKANDHFNRQEVDGLYGQKKILTEGMETWRSEALRLRGEMERLKQEISRLSSM